MSAPISRELKDNVVEAAKKIANLGLTPLTQGNISLRDPRTELVYVTPHDYPYEIMTADDIAVVDLEGHLMQGTLEPSSEAIVHCIIYQKRPDVMGVVHSEPIYANAFGISNRPIEPVFVNMAIDVGGEVPVMPFTASGSREFALEMLEVMGNRNAVIWANHGLLTVGATLQKAVHCTVMVESNAKMYFLADHLGTPNTISAEVIGRLTHG